ncbi:hypothetical protein [Heyndrickxia ginsengihumi]|uniref:hypothetical protein n=1 Tax=Heyndrickxia ginsengihumi TaxID=363870 RepID=UPI003D220EB6
MEEVNEYKYDKHNQPKIKVHVNPHIINKDTQAQAQLEAQRQRQEEFQVQLQAQLQKIFDLLKSKR